ncbi:metallophosphoesterase [Haloplanus rallus]|jgi:putative phosphoesterase|uniref:Phosphoesterase n=1 Tax=Haloplanus rallus TaxID=1816183 RepID=A0A6B9FFD5_9EURY|nr:MULTISPECIES: metallophosphoesterase family protein [Haloplanus]QGX95409.1 metallophosphoesterase [Haloplanus rallus]
MRLAIIGDTHIPDRATGIPDWVRERVEAADHVVHVGDFEGPAVVEGVRSLADGNLTAVRGNVDPPSVELPSVATVELGGVAFVVTHGTGNRIGYEDRVAAAVRDHGGDVGVAGHTHQHLDTEHDGVRLLNPGSATGADPATETTMLSATVAGGDLDVTLHRGGE